MGRASSEPPFVSVVLPVRDEAPHLPRCLAALAAQSYPRDRFEVIVADGGSTDGSAAIAQRYAAQGLPVRVLPNPAGSTPAGLNVGVRHARGAVIVILGARAEVAPDFLAHSVAALARTGADAVGGVVESAPWAGRETPTARAIALALRSPFGVGDARYRYAAREQEVDTVNYGAYRREVFERVGLFDESMTWVEDDEFNYRLRAAGGRLVLAPSIRVRYYARPTLGALWRQHFRWGFNKPRVARRHPAQMRPRHAVPALFVATVLGSALAAPRLRLARLTLAAVLGAYALAAATATTLANRTARRRGEEVPWSVLLRLPLTFATMHLAYGAGTVLGLARLGWDAIGCGAARGQRPRQGPP
jgi:glycosyltransferase involved in cell wall biosynthesis